MEGTRESKREKKKMVTLHHSSLTTKGSSTIISSSPLYSPSDRHFRYKHAISLIDKVSSSSQFKGS